MKRQRGRNRGGGSLNSGGGGGGKPQQNVNRAFDSNGPDNVKIRGHAQHVFEKYQQLARDAFSSGDRVVAENYLQHADHYFRVLRTLQPQRPAAEILGRDVFASGLDLDFEDEMESFEENVNADAGVESSQDLNGADAGRQDRFESRQDARYDARRDGQPREYQGRENQGRDVQDGRREERFEPRRDGQRDNPDGARSDGQRYETREPRRDAQGGRAEPRRDDRGDAPRSDTPRNDAQRDSGRRPDNRRERDGRSEYGDRPRNEDRAFDNRSRDERPRDERTRDERPREDRRPNRVEPELAEASQAVGESEPTTMTEAKPLPFAPQVGDSEAQPVLRSGDGGVSEAPAFLQAPAASSPEDGAEPRRPRPRRRRPKASDGEDGGGVNTAAVEDA